MHPHPLSTPRLKQHRDAAAALAREIRAEFPNLKGEWSRINWNAQARNAARRHVMNMVRFDHANR